MLFGTLSFLAVQPAGPKPLWGAPIPASNLFIFQYRKTPGHRRRFPQKQMALRHLGTERASASASASGRARPPTPPCTHLKRPPQCWHCSPTQPAGQMHWPVPGLQRPPLTQGRSHSLASAAAEPDTVAAAAAASAAQGSSSGGSSRSSRGRRSPAPSPGLPAPVVSQPRRRPPVLPAGSVVAGVLLLSLASVAAAAATIFPGLRRRPATTYTHTARPAPLRLAVRGGAVRTVARVVNPRGGARAARQAGPTRACVRACVGGAGHGGWRPTARGALLVVQASHRCALPYRIRSSHFPTPSAWEEGPRRMRRGVVLGVLRLNLCFLLCKTGITR